MWWTILVIAGILVLAAFIRKAAKGTPFASRCPCTPYVEHLRRLEDKKDGHTRAKEHLW